MEQYQGLIGPYCVPLQVVSPWRSKSESFLDVLSDGHGAQDVQEDERAVGEIVAQEVAMRETLKIGENC
jgi:hypothetical protein